MTVDWKEITIFMWAWLHNGIENMLFYEKCSQDIAYFIAAKIVYVHKTDQQDIALVIALGLGVGSNKWNSVAITL